MISSALEIPVKKPRRFLPENLVIDSWDKLVGYFEELKNRTIDNTVDLENWLKDKSELEAVLEEDMGWRYIKMSIDTTDKELSDNFHFFLSEIEPNIAPYFNAYNKKLIDSPYIEELKGDGYATYIRKIKKELEIYREENIPLITKLKADEQKYGAIAAEMTVDIDGQQVTMQEATKQLKGTDRERRKDVYDKISKRRLQDKDELNALYTDLIRDRHQIALNAGFENYRDYMFAEMGRFDYTPQDCFDFHDAIAKTIVPIIDQFKNDRRQKLGLDVLKPWDNDVDPENKPALKPFHDGGELLEKSVKCFDHIHPYFGEKLAIMKEMGHLDLSSKKGKAPGGFNYPLYEIGVPFIYMNAVGSQRDLVTMVHEGGHAVHSFLSRDLPLTGFKSLTSEVAELASMSMEFITMDHWDEFYDVEEELNRAKKEQLEGALATLPWVASIDKFQHWVYENPFHSVDERENKWVEIMKEFSSSVIDWSDNEDDLKNMWQKQLHLFEVPFYYIEYGMAQLGAIAVWRNYKSNPTKAIEQYMDALKLGYTKTIGEIYETAGIKFDFSMSYVKELADFIDSELGKI